MDRLVAALSLASGQVGAAIGQRDRRHRQDAVQVRRVPALAAGSRVLLRLADGALDRVQGWKSAEDPAMRVRYASVPGRYRS